MLINSPLSVVRKKCSSSRFELNRVNRKPGRDLGEPRGGSPGKSRSSEWEELYVDLELSVDLISIDYYRL